ncbi:MAG: MFS transporter [Actinomycetota bacterium]
MRRPALLGAVAGAFASLDTAVNVAFPAIDEHFDLDVADLQWIVITYLLTYGALLIAVGRVGDEVGHGRLVRAGAGVSMVALTCCALAPTFGLFLASRVLQGMGNALVLAGAPALLTTSVEPTESTQGGSGRAGAVAVFQTASMLGLAVGPAIGGPLVEGLGWQAVYWFRVPVAAALFVLGRDQASERGLTSGAIRLASLRERLEGVEMLTGVAAVAGVVATLSLGGRWGWTSAPLLAVGSAAVLAVALFVRRNRSSALPTVEPTWWRRPGFTRANALTVVANGASFPTWLLVPTLLIDENGVGTIAGGFMLACLPALSALGSATASRAISGLGIDNVVRAGLALAAVGMAVIAGPGASGAVALTVAGLALTGLGIGMFSVPNMHQVMGALPDERQGVAGGLSLMARTLGIVVTVAAASAVFDALEPDRGFETAFRAVFVAAACSLIVAALFAAPGRASERGAARFSRS